MMAIKDSGIENMDHTLIDDASSVINGFSAKFLKVANSITSVFRALEAIDSAAQTNINPAEVVELVAEKIDNLSA